MDEANPLFHSSVSGIKAEDATLCDTRSGRKTLSQVREELEGIYEFLEQRDLERIDDDGALRDLYEKIASCYIPAEDEVAIGELVQGACVLSQKTEPRALHEPFVMDALQTFHEIAVNPRTEEMVALYALGYAVALGRDPALLMTGDAARPCVEMMLATVQECRENGCRSLRRKADRAANGLAYERGMARFLSAEFIDSTELTCTATQDDTTRNGFRVEAFDNWLEQTQDVEGRVYLLNRMRGDFEQYDTQMIACSEARENAQMVTPYAVNQRKLLAEFLRRGHERLSF